MVDMFEPLRRAALSAAAALCLIAPAAPLAAAEPAGAIDLRELRPGFIAVRAWRDCAPDARRLCAGVRPGGGRIAFCLSDNYDALSEACARTIDAGRATRDATLSCIEDAERFCHGVPPGGGRIVSCLIGNQDRLSPDCAADLRRAWDLLNHR